METAVFEQTYPPTEKIQYKDSTYEIVSKVAFLIGVPFRIFENEHESPQLLSIKGWRKTKAPELSEIYASSELTSRETSKK